MVTEKNGRNITGKKSSESGRDTLEKVSSATIEHYLKGIHYPTSKNDLINKAKENNAPSDVMHILHQFTDYQYSSPIDVSKEVGRIE